MMPQYHINPEFGVAFLCNTTPPCDFGDDRLHFDTKSDAEKAYKIKSSKLSLSEIIRLSVLEEELMECEKND